jgi:hypothetical protein
MLCVLVWIGVGRGDVELGIERREMGRGRDNLEYGIRY